MIRRVRIEGYKSFSDFEVELAPLSVIFGPNAAGKSNFLDALQLLSRAVTSRTLKEAFEPPYRGTPLESFRFDAEGLAGHLQQDRLELTLQVDVDLSESTIRTIEQQIADMRSGNGGSVRREGDRIKERSLRYRLRVEILPRTGILRVADEYLAALRDDGEVRQSRNPFVERKDERLRLRMECQAHPTYHDVGLDHTLISRPLYPPHYPHISAFREELSRWAFFYFEPRERMRAPNPVKEVRHVGLMGEELAAFLNTLRATDAKQFEGIERVLHTLVPRVTHVEVKPTAVGEVELQLVENGIPVPARLVSEGTLRMLGLLAAVSGAQPPTLVAFEEPENGIHPRRIRFLAEFLLNQSRPESETQFVVTTHSALLPDLLQGDALFVCKRVGNRTEISPMVKDPLYLRQNIDRALEDDEEPLKPSQRILRGDFDG